MNERKQMTALHGALVVRLVDRMMQFRFDRARALIEGKFDDDGPEHLSRYAEATALVAIVHAAKFTELPRSYDTDTGDDIGAYFRLYALAEGHVLTAQDVRDLEAVLAEYNDEIGRQAEKHHEWRLDIIREIGGEELVKAVEAMDQAVMNRAVEKAMAKFRAKVAELEIAKSNADSAGQTPSARSEQGGRSDDRTLPGVAALTIPDGEA